jgi:hypothetical protein
MAFKFTLYRPTCISTWHSLELLSINNKQAMNILLFRFDENMVLQEYSFKNRTHPKTLPATSHSAISALACWGWHR